jgi:hypothetical protein
MTSGAAPSIVNETVTVGKSTSGNWLRPIRENEIKPKIIKPNINIHAKTGFLIEISDKRMNTPQTALI